MIKEAVERWESNKDKIREYFKTNNLPSYKDIVKNIIDNISDDNDFNPDPEGIHVINDGDYQGTMLFVVAEKGYQPSSYWYVKVNYGSCSGCDTLQNILDYTSDDLKDDLTDKQINLLMDLSLHIIQGLKSMQTEEV